MFKSSLPMTAVTALAAALLLHPPAAANRPSAEEIRLQALIESGDLVIDSGKPPLTVIPAPN